jgi:predicted NBD/HSP70 family sugar kinase|tara:strand:+ start:305 stop:529 length:225 start_codon:yes stop_codon:yes gene_type:complete
MTDIKEQTIEQIVTNDDGVIEKKIWTLTSTEELTVQTKIAAKFKSLLTTYIEDEESIDYVVETMQTILKDNEVL